MDLKVPVNITITNSSKELNSFRYFKVNMVQEVQPSQTIKITVKNSDEYAYYMELAKEGFTVEKVTSNNNTEPQTPSEEDKPGE